MHFEEPSRYAASASAAQSAQRSLKIALLGYRSHPHVGGQGIYLKHLSRALVQLGHSVDVLSGPPYPELDPRVKLIKIPSLDLYSVFPNHIAAFKWRFLRSWSDFAEWASMASGGFAEPYSFSRRAYAYLRREPRGYDLVHDNQCLGYGLLNIQKHIAPLAVTIHHPITQDLAIALQQEPRWGHRLLLKRWYHFVKMQTKVARKLNNLLSVSQCAQADIAKAFGCAPGRIAVIPNGIDTTLFCPQPHIARVPGRLLTTSSSDQALKGLPSLLHALHRARQSQPHLHLRIIGKLKAGGAAQKLIDTLALNDCVSFRSALSDTQLCEQYAKAQIAVCPSLYEGFGLPALEALACGTPLVCSDGGALPEVVGDAGRLFSAGDVQALTTQLTELSAEPETLQSLSRAGRERALKHYSWLEVAKQLSDYYCTVIENAHANDRLCPA